VSEDAPRIGRDEDSRDGSGIGFIKMSAAQSFDAKLLEFGCGDFHRIISVDKWIERVQAGRGRL
jgi:hypothetical protein